jgi:hypothetical protein
MRAREDKGNRLLSGGRHQLARAFESLRIRHLFTSLAQRDQSAGLRNRRSHVRIVHEVPTNKPCSTTACRSVRLSNPGSGPLEVRRDKAWQHVESEGPCSTSRPAPQGAGSVKQAHRAATSGTSSSQGAVLPGTRAQGEERQLTCRRRKPMGTGVGEQETGGAVRPCTTSSPSDIGKGSARSPSLASEGSAQIKRNVGWQHHAAREDRPSSPRGERHAVCGIPVAKSHGNHCERTSRQVAISLVRQDAKTFPTLHENGVNLGGRKTEPRLLEARKAESD